MTRTMRRFKQEIPQTEAERILRQGKYCILAVSGDDNSPYAVPINYVYDGTSIYIHSAAQGHKIDALRSNPKCSLCIVDKDDIIPAEFTSYFRSVIVFGKAQFIDQIDEKIEVLRLLGEKYSPGIIKAVCIIRITIESITGKEAIELTRARNNGLKQPH